jgi:dCTP deaminase
VVLSDRTIREEMAKGRIVIRPLGDGCVQPASVDLHLDRNILVFKNNRVPYVDVRAPNDRLTDMITMADDDPFMLHPGEFVLGSTLEHVEVPADLVARLEGKSSLGRIGLRIHSTAGYVDPGWKGHLTLELSNVSSLPITLYHRMKIGQISFLQLTTPADRLYGSAELGSKYQNQVDPTASKAHLDYKPEATN